MPFEDCMLPAGAAPCMTPATFWSAAVARWVVSGMVFSRILESVTTVGVVFAAFCASSCDCVSAGAGSVPVASLNCAGVRLEGSAAAGACTVVLLLTGAAATGAGEAGAIVPA